MATLAQDRSRHARAGPPRFVGREGELAVLTRALLEPALVLVEGEAGMGKSRLVQEFVASAGHRHRMLVGVCPPLREPLTLGPIVDALRQARSGVAGLRLSALAGALRPLFPEWAADLPPPLEQLPDAKAERHRLFRALTELIGALGATALTVEDVHWADLVTLEFLLFLTSRRHPPVLSLVVTYRPEELPAAEPTPLHRSDATSLLLRLSSRPPVGGRHLRIPLRALGQRDTARLISSMLGGERVSDAFASFLHERTEGVPLAVEESVRLLHARGDLVCHDGEWMRRRLDELHVPPTVRDAVLERVGRLGRSTRRVLRAAAVLAAAADETAVTAVAGLAGPVARVGLAEAAAAGLLREDDRGRVAFRHVLMGQAVYEAIPPATRRRLHLAAGRALEEVDPAPPEQLAHHFRAAGETTRWSRYAERAADLASGSGDYDAAVVRLNDLLTTAHPPVATRVRIARKLAYAASFRREAVDDLHRQVVASLRSLLDTVGLDPQEDAEIRSGLGRLLAQLGDFESARSEIERAVPHLGHDPVEAARAMRFLGLPFVGDGPASMHRRWLERASEVETNRLPPGERLALTVDRAAGLLQLGEEAGWRVAAELPTAAASAEERRQVARGCLNIGCGAIVWGRYPQARKLLAAAAELAEADRYLRIRPQIEISQAQLDWLTGAWDGLTERVGSLADPDRDEPLALLGAVRLGLWHLAQGSHRRAEKHLGQALEEARRLGAVDDVLEPAAALGRLRLAEGRVADALRETDEPMRTIEAKGIWVWATDVARVRVEALVGAGELESAAGVVSAYRRGLRDCHAPAGRAALATCHALLIDGRGDPARAAVRFSEAAGAWERLPRPYDALLARERQALCQLATGRHPPAVDLLHRTFQGLSVLGARGDADRVAGRLREYGVDARREWRRGRRGYGDQLSPRELDVVRLVATGATNREVAAALSRSPKTVAGQLSSAMRKLGATSRTEVAVGALQTGILPDAPGGPPVVGRPW